MGFHFANAPLTSACRSSWDNTETQSSFMYITWPSSSSMWWLTCLSHEITHASIPHTYTYWWPLSVIWLCWGEILCHKHHCNICDGSFWNLTHEPPNPESTLASEVHDWRCLTYCPASSPWLFLCMLKRPVWKHTAREVSQTSSQYIALWRMFGECNNETWSGKNNEV